MEPQLRSVAATRYVEPLREGGSLPGLMEADDDGLYVAKYRGAGQGPAALVAEVVVGELARRLGLPVPELVTLGLRAELARAEPDPEIQDLLYASAGTNLGVDFLPGALPFTPAAVAEIDPELAADVVWLDALTTNVDRSPRNPNLLRVARAHVAHRPRRGALSPARPAAAGEHRARPLPGHRRPRAAAARPDRCTRPTSAWPRPRRRRWRPPWRWCPRTGSARIPSDAGAISPAS